MFVHVSSIITAKYIIHLNNENLFALINYVTLPDDEIITMTGLLYMLSKGKFTLDDMIDINSYGIELMDFEITPNDTEILKTIFMNSHVLKIAGRTMNESYFNIRKNNLKFSLEDNLYEIDGLLGDHIHTMTIEYLATEDLFSVMDLN